MKEEIAQVNVTGEKKSKSVKEKKPIFSTRTIAGVAIFTAIAYGVSFLEFSLFPASVVPFLKLDFSNVFIMLAGFMYGPVAAILSGVIKELLCLIGTQTIGVGQLANMAVILVYALPPSVIYVYKKGIKVVIASLSLACVLQIVAGVLVNKYVNFPLYGIESVFEQAVWLIVAFNAIKSISVSALTVLLYKRVGYVFEKINIK